MNWFTTVTDTIIIHKYILLCCYASEYKIVIINNARELIIFISLCFPIWMLSFIHTDSTGSMFERVSNNRSPNDWKDYYFSESKCYNLHYDASLINDNY